MKNYRDMCIFILQQTEDGDELAPHELKLVEIAANGDLSEVGEVALYELYSRIQSGTYSKPWHFGVEGITKDHEGYIYWRNKRIEHYSFCDSERERLATQELGRLCKMLEDQGLEVTWRNLSKAYDEKRKVFEKESAIM